MFLLPLAKERLPWRLIPTSLQVSDCKQSLTWKVNATSCTWLSPLATRFWSPEVSTRAGDYYIGALIIACRSDSRSQIKWPFWAGMRWQINEVFPTIPQEVLILLSTYETVVHSHPFRGDWGVCHFLCLYFYAPVLTPVAIYSNMIPGKLFTITDCTLHSHFHMNAC